MKLKLERIAYRDTYTIGKLFIDYHDDNYYSYFCDTLEDKVRVLQDSNHDGDFDEKDEGKIWGKTAIPAGTYLVELAFSPHFKRILPHLINVPGFQGILIHNGNTDSDTHGCLLVGINKEAGKVLDSVITLEKLMNILNPQFKLLKQIEIQIK